MSFVVVTDSSANLSQELLHRYGIRTASLSYIVNGQLHDCPASDVFDAPAFYQLLRSGTQIQTSLSNCQRFVDVFESVLRNGQDVLCITISGGISGTHQAACQAALMLRGDYPKREIFVIDSQAAGLGEGLLALYVAQLQEQGYDLHEALPRLEHKLTQLSQVFTVEDLMYLRRGGRVSGVAAVMGTVLHIRPILRGEDGHIAVSGKARGKKGAIQALLKAYETEAAFGGPVAITHADAEADAQALLEGLQARDPAARILTAPFEPISGAHVGPGALALFYFKK